MLHQFHPRSQPDEWIGDPPDLLELVLYCYADLAGDRTDSKSTSGVFMCLLGPCSFMPLNALSKKQTSVSKSTPEAEIVSLDHAPFKSKRGVVST